VGSLVYALAVWLPVTLVHLIKHLLRLPDTPSSDHLHLDPKPRTLHPGGFLGRYGLRPGHCQSQGRWPAGVEVKVARWAGELRAIDLVLAAPDSGLRLPDDQALEVRGGVDG